MAQTTPALNQPQRAARADAGGTVVTIATAEQAAEVRILTKQAGIRPTTVPVRPGAAEITALTGPAAAYVEPAAVVELPAQQGGGGGRRGGGGGGGPKKPVASKPAGAKRAGGSRGGSGGGPARTRADLAARAGQVPSRSSGRGRAR